MKAIILAGGMAKRLRPVTNNLPKCLLNVGGKTIIDRQIENLLQEGVEEIILVTGFKSELLEQHIQLHHPSKNIRIIKNELYESTGPAYGLWCAREALGKTDLIYLNGDLVCDHAVIRDIIQSKKSSLTAVSRNTWDEEQVKVAINPERSVKALGKWIVSEDSYGEFVGATKISKTFGQALKQILETLKNEGVLSGKFAADTLNETINQTKGGLMYIHDVTNYRTIEIDTPSDFKTASNMWSKQTMGKFGTLLKIILARIVHLISYLFPRQVNKVIFIGWHKNNEREVFADNSKYLFLETHHKYRPKIRPIWIAQDQKMQDVLNQAGFESYCVYSFAGMWHALTSKFTIVDAHINRGNWQFTGRSKVVQLWHGKGMKKSSLVQKGGVGISRLVAPELFQKFDFLIASSQYTAELMADIFKVSLDKVLVTGLPRNDVLFTNIPGAEVDIDQDYKKIMTEFKGKGTSKIIAYMPTFRRNSSNPLDQIDLEKINTALKATNSYMLITLHPKFATRNYETLGTLEHIRILRAGYDLYPLLKNIDMLITDYSSIYVDYLLLNRPIIFYTYDRENYEKETGLYSDFDEMTPGPHVSDFNTLIETVINYDDDKWQKKRTEVTSSLHSIADGNSADRIVQQILKKI
jgi:CDP-glycerol glycerophosphotransferase (TagB/SpsB family)/choline kinase